MARTEGIKISVTDDDGILLDVFYMATKATIIEARTLDHLGRTEHLCELTIGTVEESPACPTGWDHV